LGQVCRLSQEKNKGTGAPCALKRRHWKQNVYNGTHTGINRNHRL
jgi:hypothetical protein